MNIFKLFMMSIFLKPAQPPSKSHGRHFLPDRTLDWSKLFAPVSKIIAQGFKLRPV